MNVFKIFNWHKHGLIENSELKKLLELEKKNTQFKFSDYIALRFVGAAMVVMTIISFFLIRLKNQPPYAEVLIALPLVAFIYLAFSNFFNEYKPEESIPLGTDHNSKPESYYVSTPNLNKQIFHNDAANLNLSENSKKYNIMTRPQYFKIENVSAPKSFADSTFSFLLRLIIALLPLPFMYTILYVFGFFVGLFFMLVFRIKESNADEVLVTFMFIGGLIYLYFIYLLFRRYFKKREN